MSKKDNRWTMTVLEDGSGVALSEWKSEYVCREYIPSQKKPTVWERDDSYPEYAGISNRYNQEIPWKLAKRLLKVWKRCRKSGVVNGWMSL